MLVLTGQFVSTDLWISFKITERGFCYVLSYFFPIGHYPLLFWW